MPGTIQDSMQSAVQESLEGALLSLLHRDAERENFEDLREQINLLPDSEGKKRLLTSAAMAITVMERLVQHKQRERGLLAVIETAQDLTAITDTDAVLHAIVQRARKLLGCDVGYLSIYDEKHQDFYVRATDGAFSEQFRKVRVGMDVGVCGYVARHRTPYSSSDYLGDSRFSHDVKIDAAMQDENIQSILGVPLLAGERVSGVLFVGDRYLRAYSAWEKSILATLGAHASVAIDNARLFEQAQEALARASATNELLARQSAGARAAAEAHEALTSLVARGGDLSDICDMISSRLGGRVAVCDETGKEICVSETGAEAGAATAPARRATVGRRAAFEAGIHTVLDEARRRGRSVQAYERRGDVCRICAVMGGRGLLGGLVIHTPQALDDVAVRILERAGMVAGIVLLLRRQQEFSLRSDAPAILRALTYAPQGDVLALAPRAAAHGLDLERPMQLALLRVAGNVSTVPGWLPLSGLSSFNALCDEDGVNVCVLVNLADAPRVRHALEAGMAEAQYACAGVISLPVHDARALPDARRRCEACLDLLDALGRGQIVADEQSLALYTPLLAGANAPAAEDLLAATLGPLYRPGHARSQQLARTLLAYLDHGYNASAAAKSLGLHLNTLRQRLEVAQVLLGDWRADGRALELHMGLRLWHLRDELPPAQRASGPGTSDTHA
ncbi:GAF domain-containing protein [Allopusillimonas soli]|uniref:GAF domain-containing protein n=1 Tax=Allopusillimonas soli TaxID=659016 RepID=A0A853FAF0_9BURK|nr:GAF domain-containing protein [Allopusillimonas soli]NYT36909.1 GAF domain-containing protein [Allopusillimonas soli]TEA75366.1 GAF domain-containing protein [Allopusillimonas soli]